MTTRLLIAYLLIVVLIGGLSGAIWWAIHNSPHRKMKRYYREKRDRARP